MLGGRVYTIKENTESLVAANKEFGLEVNADETEYMVVSPYQNAGQSHNIKTDCSSVERVQEFKYL
jgi:hypothetical protein